MSAVPPTEVKTASKNKDRECWSSHQGEICVFCVSFRDYYDGLACVVPKHVCISLYVLSLSPKTTNGKYHGVPNTTFITRICDVELFPKTLVCCRSGHMRSWELFYDSQMCCIKRLTQCYHVRSGESPKIIGKLLMCPLSWVFFHECHMRVDSVECAVSKTPWASTCALSPSESLL
jgi:hypothetical protein